MPQRQASRRQGRSGSQLGKGLMFGKTADPANHPEKYLKLQNGTGSAAH
jgi:hypothetical protein